MICIRIVCWRLSTIMLRVKSAESHNQPPLRQMFTAKRNLCLGKFSFTMTSEYINESAHVSCHVSGHMHYIILKKLTDATLLVKRQQTAEKKQKNMQPNLSMKTDCKGLRNSLRKETTHQSLH